MRPGEASCYVRLDLSPARRRALRELAGSLGISVDVLVASCAELRALEDVAHGVAPSVAAMITSAASRPERLARSDALRAWCSFLRSGPRSLPDDDLPEILVPARLAARLDAQAWAAAADAVLRGEAERALQAERLAAAHGLTLTEWALREALLEARAG